jgi:hypothetical protein
MSFSSPRDTPSGYPVDIQNIYPWGVCPSRVHQETHVTASHSLTPLGEPPAAAYRPAAEIPPTGME